jgi:hypothetical protein
VALEGFLGGSAHLRTDGAFHFRTERWSEAQEVPLEIVETFVHAGIEGDARGAGAAPPAVSCEALCLSVANKHARRGGGLRARGGAQRASTGPRPSRRARSGSTRRLWAG